jgi:hypothetical protein
MADSKGRARVEGVLALNPLLTAAAAIEELTAYGGL